MIILEQGAPKIKKRSMEQRKILKKEHGTRKRSLGKRKNEKGAESTEKYKRSKWENGKEEQGAKY